MQCSNLDMTIIGETEINEAVVRERDNASYETALLHPIDIGGAGVVARRSRYENLNSYLLTKLKQQRNIHAIITSIPNN